MPGIQGSVAAVGCWDSCWYSVADLDPTGESSLVAMSHRDRPLVEATKGRIVRVVVESHVEVNGSDAEGSTAHWDLLAVCAVDLANAQQLV